MSELGYVNEEGHIVVPEEFRRKYGMVPGSRVKTDELPDMAVMYRPVSRLERVYVELTNRCNMRCKTCMINVREESRRLFARQRGCGV